MSYTVTLKQIESCDVTAVKIPAICGCPRRFY